ncbi:uncharacterized protein K460DRAFT_431862 [Cucurbitaria berberidis CBS 394.84]|uniref:Uncharacterized protein n=1 Tax=Cucurbitaria berberidis CBS 394.84 TaxID=1168544 RepID=A0A9P4GIG5_9PLEO|nr:uncharacterized protein K460DRAFT_431862 [Cucurbitaria berberidis CBS 394.84]KAF1846778.1 hypothetical protein K460DRAFT_431862 [Cucurbitaria berberidis CBS 394.84]
MNALDLLVDFATFMSTSSDMTMMNSGNNEHDAPASSAQYTTSTPAFKQSIAAPLTNNPMSEASLGASIVQSSTALSSSGLECSSNQSHRTSPDRAKYDTFDPLLTNAQSHPVAQTLDMHLQEGPGRYFRCNCNISYQHCTCRYEPVVKVCYTFARAVPVEKEPWDPTQLRPPVCGVQRLFELPIPEDGFPWKYSYQGNMCHCRYVSPHIHCMPDGFMPVVAKETLGLNELRCDVRAASGHVGL